MVTFTCLMEITLPEWLQEQLTAKNMSAADLARKSGISAPQITRLLTGQRGVSEISLRAISEALGITPEVAFRVAGFLPPVPKDTEQHQQLLYLFDQMTLEKRKDLLFYAEFLLRK
jgi:transcriptional regulator with XRE-family HTH domain